MGERFQNNDQDTWFSMSMDNHLDHYHDSNEIARRDAIESLAEFGSKLQFKPNAKVIEIGCADGAVSNIIFQHLPKDIEIFLCCDKNKKALEYAEKRYKNAKITYKLLNIEEDVTDDLKGQFDNFFSLLTFHWIPQQKKAFQNVYDLLAEGGHCFVTVKSYSHLYHVYFILSRSKKWRPFLRDINKFVSPYYRISLPDQKIKEILQSVGFKNIEVRTKQKVFTFKKADIFRNLNVGVNPFDVPEEETDNFFDDIMDIAHTLDMVNEQDGSLTLLFIKNIIHCTK